MPALKHLTAKFGEKMSALLPQVPAHLALGVSGGSDSLALLYLVYAWGKEQAKKIRLTVLSVDHQLRPSSRAEAELAQAAARRLGVDAHILTWRHQKLKTGLEEKARRARAELMHGFCKLHQIDTLLLAHHQGDDIETLLINLGRGSGLAGLSGIAAKSDSDGMLIIRPLLDFTKEELREVCRAAGIRWAEDESNVDQHFLRNRVRAFIPAMKRVGITPEKLAYAVRELKRAREAIEFYVDSAREECVSYEGGKWRITPAFHAYPEEVALRLMANIIKETGSAPYPPRLASLQRVYERLRLPGPFRATLGGALISRNAKGEITLAREKRRR